MRASLIVLSLFTLAAGNAQALNLVKCLAEHSKAECRRQMLIEDAQNKPLTTGDKVLATSQKYYVTIQGEDWLQNSWAADPDKAKDLGLIKDSGVGMLSFEKTDVAQADAESVLTNDMKALYDGLQKGFKKGKIPISAGSQMELLPLTIKEGAGTLGRFCYHMDMTAGKSVCVYEGIVTGADGASFKLLGSIGDYNDMRQEFESIITSFTFHEPDEDAPAPPEKPDPTAPEIIH